MSEVPAPAPQRNILEKVFFSPDERRLRAGWRLLLHTVLIFLIIYAIASIIYFAPTVLQTEINPDIVSLANTLIALVVITGATFLARRFFDRRSIVSLGLKPTRQAVYDVLAGIVITFFMMGLVYLIEVVLGWTTFEGFSWQTDSGATVVGSLLFWLLVFLIVGWYEELLSRGYHLQNIADGLNMSWGVVISSAIFGFLHISNDNASWTAILGITLAGLFLALPYLLTRQLWLSVGLHIGWNFFEGVVFGFPVSGLDTYRLLRQTVNGPELWTGGAFGPEAGLLVIPALLLGTLLVYGYTRLRIRPATTEQPST